MVLGLRSSEREKEREKERIRESILKFRRQEGSGDTVAPSDDTPGQGQTGRI